jgi:hypothetical protein
MAEACYLIYGGNNLQSVSMSDLVGNGLGIKMYGSADYQKFGFAVAPAGDMNKDGFADFLISNGDFQNVYLFCGGASLSNSTTAASAAPGDESSSFSGVTFPTPFSSGESFGIAFLVLVTLTVTGLVI